MNDGAQRARSVVIHVENAVTCDDEKLLLALMNTINKSIRAQVPDVRLFTVADMRRNISYVIFDDRILRTPKAPKAIRMVVIMALPEGFCTKLTARGKLRGRLICDIMDGFVDPVFYVLVAGSLNEKRDDIPVLVCSKDTDFANGDGWIDADVDAMACCSES